jgi:hypothetical protein
MEVWPVENYRCSGKLRIRDRGFTGLELGLAAYFASKGTRVCMDNTAHAAWVTME